VRAGSFAYCEKARNVIEVILIDTKYYILNKINEHSILKLKDFSSFRSENVVDNLLYLKVYLIFIK